MGFFSLFYLDQKKKLASFFARILHPFPLTTFDLRYVKENRALLCSHRGNYDLEVQGRGRLAFLSSPWKRGLFRCKNCLFWGRPQKRTLYAIEYTFASHCSPLINPLEPRLSRAFFARHTAFLQSWINRIEGLNGLHFPREILEIHLDLYKRATYSQSKVVQKMQKATRRQKRTEELMEAQMALGRGGMAILEANGRSGGYWICNARGERLGLFKPFDEEYLAPHNPRGLAFRGPLGKHALRRGCLVGECSHHEVAAFLVDEYFGFSIVPKTFYGSFLSGQGEEKRGSFQVFIDGPKPFLEAENRALKAIPLIDFQLLMVLDVILGNTDRNLGNILFGEGELVAIDHGLCFPDTTDELSFLVLE